MDYDFIEDNYQFIDDSYYEIEELSQQDIENLENSYLLLTF